MATASFGFHTWLRWRAKNEVSAKVAGLIKQLPNLDTFLSKGHVNEAQSDLCGAICEKVTSDVRSRAGKVHICKALASKPGFRMDGRLD